MIQLIDANRKIIDLGNLKYSENLGRYLLHKIIKERGVEMLLHYGLTEKRIKRIIDKGATGGEVDMLRAIYYGAKHIESKFMEEREYQLIKEHLPNFMQYFHIKPVMILSLTSGWSFAKMSQLYLSKDYYTLMFSKDQSVLNRRLFYDAWIWLVAELYKLIQFNKEVSWITFTSDLSDGEDKINRIYYNLFSKIKLQTRDAKFDVVIMKHNREGLNYIPKLYNELIRVYKQHGIAKLQPYAVDRSGVVIRTKFGLHYGNFASNRCLYVKHLRQAYRDNYAKIIQGKQIKGLTRQL